MNPYMLCVLAVAAAAAAAGAAVLIRRSVYQRNLRKRRRYMWAREQELVGLTVAHLYLEHGNEQVWADFVAGHREPRPDPQAGA